LPWESLRGELPALHMFEAASPVHTIMAQPHRAEMILEGVPKPLVFFPDFHLTVDARFASALARGIPFCTACAEWRPDPATAGETRELVVEVKTADDRRNSCIWAPGERLEAFVDRTRRMTARAAGLIADLSPRAALRCSLRGRAERQGTAGHVRLRNELARSTTMNRAIKAKNTPWETTDSAGTETAPKLMMAVTKVMAITSNP
jgi:hypothetical protein